MAHKYTLQEVISHIPALTNPRLNPKDSILLYENSNTEKTKYYTAEYKDNALLHITLESDDEAYLV